MDRSQAFHERRDPHLLDEARAWVSRFAPLVMEEGFLPLEDAKRKLRLVEELQWEAPRLQQGLSGYNGAEYCDLCTTFQRASTQLESLENDLRQQIARLSPGDPDGMADLATLRDRLDERMAKQEMGVSTHTLGPMQERISHGSVGTAAGLGVFALAMLSFTTFHAIFMIGGMWKAFGPLALLLLGFYSVFFYAAFSMGKNALNLASDEEIQLVDRTLVVRKVFAGRMRERAYRLGAESRAEMSGAVPQWQSGSNPLQPMAVVHDAQGRKIVLGVGASLQERERLVERINGYLRSH
jgi:hypothetical protein